MTTPSDPLPEVPSPSVTVYGAKVAPAGAVQLPRPGPTDPRDSTDRDLALRVLEQLRKAIATVIVGYEDVARILAIALITEGHVLVEGVPGLAKTYLARSFARALDLSFRRIQFTPDMLPSDILGTVVLNPREQQFEFRPGPIFTNVILADEINRAPPKVQSAFLEGMQERQVTIDGKSYPLPRPFLVIATENPIEQEGTYPLPEAELDRFLFRWLLDYPSAEDERQILRSRTGREPVSPVGLIPADEIDRLRELVPQVYVSEDLIRYIATIIRTTREDPAVQVGASPRAGIHLLHAGQAAALFAGRNYVIPDDVRDLVLALLNHRLVLRPSALAGKSSRSGWGGSLERISETIQTILTSVEVPRAARVDTWGRP
ncbi:MAG: MoxR family ATPase [Thermoplasmata archaeon]|nr:MoxR family ATPase [Thermoplasmata archaeon]